MYELNDTYTKVVDRPYGYAVQVYTRGGADLWMSAPRLTTQDANGFAQDVEGALATLACVWCNQPATRIDHIGNLDSDTSDIIGFCSDSVCVREAKRELELS